MRIAHICTKPLSGNPANLVSALREVADIDATLVGIGVDSKNPPERPIPVVDSLSSDATQKAIYRANILHFHDCHPLNLPPQYQRLAYEKPIVVQWYSSGMPCPTRSGGPPMYWACLASKAMSWYPQATPLPHVLPLRESRYIDSFPVLKSAEQFRVGACIHKGADESADPKGIIKAVTALKRLKGVEVDLFIEPSGLAKKKRGCHIAIDDLMSGGYHYNGLEFLSVGVPTICDLQKSVFEWLVTWADGELPPILLSDLGSLVETVAYFRDNAKARAQVSYHSREWMLKYWNEYRTLDPYIWAYRELEQGVENQHAEQFRH